MALADLTRIPIPYVLEIYLGSGTKPESVTTLPFGPSTMQVRTPPPVKIQRTFGRLPIRQHSRYCQWMVTITGRSGLRARPGYDFNGAIAVKTGPQLFQDFQAWLQLYTEMADKFGAEYLQNPDEYDQHLDNVRLVFRAPDKDLHLLVEPVDFTWQSTAISSRFSYEWTLVLEGYAEASYSAPTNLLGPVAEWAKAGARAVNKANAAVALGALVLGNVRSDLDVLRLPLQRARTTAALAQQTVAAGLAVASLPRDMLADIAVTAEQTRAVWERLADAGRLPAETAAAGRDIARAFYAAQDTARDAMTAYGGMRGGPDGLATAQQVQDAGGGPGGLPSSPSQPSADCQVYQLGPGDSLKDVANKYLGSSELWTQIAYLNGLPDPYHKSDGTPLLPGDTVLVPQPAGSTGIDAAAGQDLSSLFGVDWYIDPDTGDVEVDASGNDFRTIDGLDNLQQALRLRMLTVQGTSGFQDFGLPVEPGQAFGPQMAGYVAAHAREQLLRDPRVSKVTDMQVLDGGDSLAVRAKVEPIVAGAFSLTAPFPSAT